MRKNLKEKIDRLISKLGPEIFENFNEQRLVKPKSTTDAARGPNDDKTTP